MLVDNGKILHFSKKTNKQKTWFFFSPPLHQRRPLPGFQQHCRGRAGRFWVVGGWGGWISGWGAGLRSAELWLIHFWLRGVTPQCIDKELIPSLARVKTCLPSPLITGLISLSRCHSRGAPPINTNPRDNNRSINPSQRGVMEWNCSACTPARVDFFPIYFTVKWHPQPASYRKCRFAGRCFCPITVSAIALSSRFLHQNAGKLMKKKEMLSLSKTWQHFMPPPRNLSFSPKTNPASRKGCIYFLMEMVHAGTCGAAEGQQNSLTHRLRAILLYFNIYLSDRGEVIRETKLKDIQACEWRVTKRDADEPVGTKCLSRRFAAFAKPLAHIYECADVLWYTGR